MGTAEPVVGVGGLGDDEHRSGLVECRGQRRAGSQDGSRLVAPGDRRGEVGSVGSGRSCGHNYTGGPGTGNAIVLDFANGVATRNGSSLAYTGTLPSNLKTGASGVFVDLNATYRLSDKLSIFAEAKNLTNQPLRYFQGVKERTMQLEYYSYNWNVGLKYDF